MEKPEKAESVKSTLKKKSFDWESFLVGLGIEVSKGLLVGASMSLGKIAVDRAFAPKVSDRHLTLIQGDNRKIG